MLSKNLRSWFLLVTRPLRLDWKLLKIFETTSNGRDKTYVPSFSTCTIIIWQPLWNVWMFQHLTLRFTGIKLSRFVSTWYSFCFDRNGLCPLFRFDHFSVSVSYKSHNKKVEMCHLLDKVLVPFFHYIFDFLKSCKFKECHIIF